MKLDWLEERLPLQSTNCIYIFALFTSQTSSRDQMFQTLPQKLKRGGMMMGWKELNKKYTQLTFTASEAEALRR